MSTALCLAGGTIAFLLFLASDVCILRRWKGARACFTLGGILLAGGTLGLLCGAGIPAAFRERPVAAAISAAGACASLGVLIHVLFFALPEEAYRTGGRTVKTGWYALCRHPGVLWFGALYVCLAALVCTGEMLVAALLFTGLDVAYVGVQDRWIFPKTLQGYAEYQAVTPFLIPTRRSLRAMRGR